MSEPDDRRLRTEFEALRSAESAGAPEFEQTVRAALTRADRPRFARWRPVFVAAAAAALVVLVVLRTANDPREAPPALDELGVWATPTDILLDTPGSGLLRDLPRWDLPDPNSATGGSGASTSRFYRRNRA